MLCLQGWLEALFAAILEYKVTSDEPAYRFLGRKGEPAEVRECMHNHWLGNVFIAPEGYFADGKRRKE